MAVLSYRGIGEKVWAVEQGREQKQKCSCCGSITYTAFYHAVSGTIIIARIHVSEGDPSILYTISSEDKIIPGVPDYHVFDTEEEAIKQAEILNGLKEILPRKILNRF